MNVASPGVQRTRSTATVAAAHLVVAAWAVSSTLATAIALDAIELAPATMTLVMLSGLVCLAWCWVEVDAPRAIRRLSGFVARAMAGASDAVDLSLQHWPFGNVPACAKVPRLSEGLLASLPSRAPPTFPVAAVATMAQPNVNRRRTPRLDAGLI